MNVLVLHGPGLDLLGERPGDPVGLTLEALDAALRRRARELGASLRVVQSNHEGALIDALHAQRRWADGVLLAPEALRATSYALRDAIVGVAKPTFEVQLSDVSRAPEVWRRRSVLAEVCKGESLGGGLGAYLGALDRLAALVARPPAKSLGRGGKRRATTPAAPAPKTLGRRSTEISVAEIAAAVSRAALSERIRQRLSGKLTATELAAWARSVWPAEASHASPDRESLEALLSQLVAANAATGRVAEERLIELLARLDA